MTNLAGLLSNKPYKITRDLYLYQPVLYDIIQMTEEIYWSLVKIWTLKRHEILIEENDFSLSASDYVIWKKYIMDATDLKSTLESSSLVFFRKKLEFLPHNDTIYIGEIQDGIILDESLFYILQDVFNRLTDTSTDKQSDQYKKDIKMDARAKALIAKMEASQQKIAKLKNGDFNPADMFGKQIVALVAIGHYTFEQVYNMTMLQFIYLIKKYVDIENFELHTLISPYISSKDSSQEVKHWLNT